MTWRYSAFLQQYRKVQAPQMGKLVRLPADAAAASPDRPPFNLLQATTPSPSSLLGMLFIIALPLLLVVSAPAASSCLRKAMLTRRIRRFPDRRCFYLTP